MKERLAKQEMRLSTRWTGIVEAHAREEVLIRQVVETNGISRRGPKT